MLDRLGAFGLKSEQIWVLLTERGGELSPIVKQLVDKAAADAHHDSLRYGLGPNKHVLFGLCPSINLQAEKAQVDG